MVLKKLKKSLRITITNTETSVATYELLSWPFISIDTASFLRLSCDLSLELLVPETKGLILARDLIPGFLGVMVTNGLRVNLLGVGLVSPHITVPEPKIQDCVVWCGVVRCGVVWCGVIWSGVVWCGAVWRGAVCCAVVWCRVVWCGVVCCGVLWCAVV